MDKIKHIKIGTDNNKFDWILEDEKNGCWTENNTEMLRELIKRHNEMADIINELATNKNQ